MNPYFTELGRTVLERWKKTNFSLSAFPAIAQAALEERPPAENVDLGKLVREFLLEDEQPFQSQSGFGQPELVVYDDPRFYIQILFWLEGTTDIHQHKFSGAFHVLAGSSIHSSFEFQNPEAVSAHLRVGCLRVQATELLETGSTVQIISGSSHIHSLFHLETPSLTVVIRTHTDPGTGPQFTYLPPHLAVDPFQNDALTTRRKQLLDVLEATDDPDYSALVLEMLGRLDFERGFFVLQNAMGALRGFGRWEEALDVFKARHGRLADFVKPTLDEIVWRDRLVALRGSVAEVEHRFFLALLLNVPTRAGVFAMVARRFSEEPAEMILHWAEELMESSEAGTWILDAEFPSALPVDAEDRPELFLNALRILLEGNETPGETCPHLDSLRAAFARSSLRVLVS